MFALLPVLGVGAAALVTAKILRDRKLATPIQVKNAAGSVPALTGTNGVQFVAQSPQFSAAVILPPDQFAGIIPSDMITVEAQRGDLLSSRIKPGDNVLMQVLTAPDMASMTLRAISKDPRNEINDLIPKLIPSSAITGIAPAGG